MADIPECALSALQQTCGACPSQWEGTTGDGQAIYIRYRWGFLSWGIGATDDEAVEDSLKHGFKCGGELDGVMATDEMLQLLHLAVS